MPKSPLWNRTRACNMNALAHRKSIHRQNLPICMPNEVSRLSDYLSSSSEITCSGTKSCGWQVHIHEVPRIESCHLHDHQFRAAGYGTFTSTMPCLLCMLAEIKHDTSTKCTMDYRSLLLLTFSWQSSQNYYLRSSERLSCPTLHLPAAGAAMTPENPTHVLPTTSPLQVEFIGWSNECMAKKLSQLTGHKFKGSMLDRNCRNQIKLKYYTKHSQPLAVCHSSLLQTHTRRNNKKYYLCIHKILIE